MNLRTHSRARPNGVIIEFLPDGKQIHTDTVRCVHCQRHEKWVVGSHKKHGWCPACQGMTCGTKKCDVCVHWEQELDNIEAGRPRHYKPISKVNLSNPFKVQSTVAPKELWTPFVMKK